MSEGFDSHHNFLSSVCNGFANAFNERISIDLELNSNYEASEILFQGFGREIYRKTIESVN